MATCVAKTTRTTITRIEIIDDLEAGLYDRDKYHLRDSLTRINGKTVAAPIPAGNKQLPLVIRINQASEISQHNTVFMPKTRAR